MGLRPGRCYHKVKRPYTRVSKRKPRKSYVVGVPEPKIKRFEFGNVRGDFEVNVWLIAKKDMQIRHNALEAARIILTKTLSKLGNENFFAKILVYPHQVLREHSLATGAGADRFSSGMRKAFGRPIGKAAITRKNQKLILVRVNKDGVKVAKEALKKAGSKLPTPVTILVEEKKAAA
ncbi:MAG TPA: 50S ribosomal protein L16 [Candidatus Aenigmarchaeota archaeon]|nr:50S ribosomal protein L16 [Candidatus Aenigmarchaeota archaeon]